MLGRLATSSRAPLLALLVVSLLSLGARGLLLDEPCQDPCTTASDHTLIFDEAYYVNAARVIAGIHPASGAHYADSPLGTDPNAEHPAGAKLIMAAAIELFGDGPFAWRIGSLIMGSLAILGMYALVRGAGARRWPAVGAASLMAADNLLLVHGRIATLDIYVIAGMVWAAALYLRGRPLLAGLALALATCFKEVAPYTLIVLFLVELGRLWIARGSGPPAWRVRPALGRLVLTTVTTACAFVGLLAVMDQIATPYADAEAKLIGGSPFAEIAHIISYGWHLTSPHGPQGIASYPWAWLVDLKPILYLRVSPSQPGHQAGAIQPVVAFFGMVSPPILLVGIPALIAGLVWVLRTRRGRGVTESVSETESVSDGESGAGRVVPGAVADRQLALLGAAWFIGTWVPFALQALLDQRTSYLYYMIIVMPGIYVAATWLVTMGWRWGRTWMRSLIVVWGIGVLVAAALLYPFIAVF